MYRISLLLSASLFAGCGGSGAANVKSTEAVAPDAPAPMVTKGEARADVDPETKKKRAETAEERINALEGLTEAEKRQMIKEHKEAAGT